MFRELSGTHLILFKCYFLLLLLMLFYLLLLNGSQTSGASHLPHRENQLLHGLPYTILPAIGISFHRVLKLRYVTSSFRTPFPTNISFSKQALVCKGQMNDEKDKALCLELFNFNSFFFLGLFLAYLGFEYQSPNRDSITSSLSHLIFIMRLFGIRIEDKIESKRFWYSK